MHRPCPPCPEPFCSQALLPRMYVAEVCISCEAKMASQVWDQVWDKLKQLHCGARIAARSPIALMVWKFVFRKGQYWVRPKHCLIVVQHVLRARPRDWARKFWFSSLHLSGPDVVVPPLVWWGGGGLTEKEPWSQRPAAKWGTPRSFLRSDVVTRHLHPLCQERSDVSRAQEDFTCEIL